MSPLSRHKLTDSQAEQYQYTIARFIAGHTQKNGCRRRDIHLQLSDTTAF